MHINLAKILIKEYNLDKIFFVPVGNYYEKNDLIDAYHRYNMLKLAIEDNKQLEIEKIGLESKIKLYASDTFKLIKEKYQKDNIFFVMGSDNFKKMPTWKNYEDLIKNYNIIVIERERKKIRNENPKNIIEFIPEKLASADSTKIRKMIKNNENTQKYLNPKVYKYIKQNNLYIC
ncbi:MAG: nicotinate (nicotinamide) nucleotide adenylyltransferase [Clostridia bacterium]|nr:nicotinate (nicotinamide) nucleotide adenylyltransferase [Clostridia bacterium]